MGRSKQWAGFLSTICEGCHNWQERKLGRRRLLTISLGAAASGIFGLDTANASQAIARAISFRNLHTGEKLSTVYWAEGGYVPEALSEIDRILRDFRTGEVRKMDLRLVDLLYAVRRSMRTKEPFEIISGYRSPQTNAKLARGSGGVAKRSLHMRGMAADVRLPGRDLSELRRIGRGLARGGVGYYARSNFVHLDVGRVRYW